MPGTRSECRMDYECFRGQGENAPCMAYAITAARLFLAAAGIQELYQDGQWLISF